MYTPRQVEIMNVLIDGKEHYASDIIEKVDPFLDVTTLRQHIQTIRKLLKQESKGILTGKTNGQCTYRLVKFLGDE